MDRSVSPGVSNDSIVGLAFLVFQKITLNLTIRYHIQINLFIQFNSIQDKTKPASQILDIFQLYLDNLVYIEGALDFSLLALFSAFFHVNEYHV